MQSWIIVGAAFGYIFLLFAVAHLGDRRQKLGRSATSRPAVYALSLAVYCTSWTFFGSVGVAARDGYSFIAIYLGPILLFLLAPKFIERVTRLTKAEKITSVADFLGSRYGKSTSVAALAAVIALIGTVPYISLQLKAISTSIEAFVQHYEPNALSTILVGSDLALLVALTLGVFAILFGTRYADVTEHQHGLVVAVATESIVKLLAFLAIGLWASFWLFDLPDLAGKALQEPLIRDAYATPMDGRFVISAFLSAAVILLLPRQFHMTFVENRTSEELRRARWLFPLYLVAINVFVAPIAAAGVLNLGGSVNPDFYVLALPLSDDQALLTLLVFVGGLSAATAMVIVASVALSIMVSNDLVLPFLLKFGGKRFGVGRDATGLILQIRRTAILATVLLGYVYYGLAGTEIGLASIGLLSFAAIAQFAPAFFIGLYWRGANARGAKAGLAVGIGLWFYTLLLPAVLPFSRLVLAGPFGIEELAPQSLFGLHLDPLVHGVLVSIVFNALFVFAASLTRPATRIESLQADTFARREHLPETPFRRSRTRITVGALKETIARYLGHERTERSFASFAAEQQREMSNSTEADSALLRFSEQLLGSAIGSASSRLVLSLLVQRHSETDRSALRLLDDASQAVQYNRDLLRVALDQVDQGLAIFDREARLTFWNRQFRELLGLPTVFGQVGTPLDGILRHLRLEGEIDDSEARTCLEELPRPPALRQIALSRSQRFIELRTNAMPESDGIVITVSDMTERVKHAVALHDVNETLEQRVRERTAELLKVNEKLAEARQTADAANIGKTRFLAAAGHDILQPLNAAKLYSSALRERIADPVKAELAENIGSSLESVEAILGAVLDISRLDAGGMQPSFEDLPLMPLLRQVLTDLSPLAQERGIDLRVVPTSLTVRSDRTLLRRLVQNLVSNAIKYTNRGKIIVGVRRRGGSAVLEVADSGIGIPSHQLKTIFTEFIRLDEGTRTARGLGLGLSIVDRIARVLDHAIEVNSVHGRGTRFGVVLPLRKSLALVPQQTPSNIARPMAALNLSDMRVLCIDNEQTIREGMTALLEGWGCHVATAADLKEAVERIEAQQALPDALLVDYHLDEGTGLEAVAKLRWMIGPDLPAILITADRSKELRAEAAARGIDFLTKPVKPASLRAILSQARLRQVAAE